MTRRWPRTILDEIADMRGYMDDFSRRIFNEPALQLLPSGESTDLPALYRGDLKIDVVEHNGDVTVTADMIPGVSKEGIYLELVSSQALRISCERSEEKKEEKEGYYMRERRFGSISRIVQLPSPVTDEGARSTFRNGVLEVTLKKAKGERKSRIPIE